jgi:hypothetical protein
MEGIVVKASVFLTLVCLVSVPAAAQVDQVTTPPPNLVLSNYNSVPVGPYGGLEGSAYAARIDDPSAAWFNPAGLARQSMAQVSGSAGVYQFTAVAPRALPDDGGSIQQLPNFVGFTFSPRTGLTLGAALLTTNSWNQETDSELIRTVSIGQQRFAYSADSTFEQRVAAISAGYHRGGPWRLGAGFAFSLMNIQLAQSISDRVSSAADLQSLLLTVRASGSAFQLRGQAGAQYDMGQWQFGGAIRTPAATLHRSGRVVLEGLLDVGASSIGASLFDVDAEFKFSVPWEFQGGAAYVTERYEVEVDLQAYTSIDAYSLLSTGNPLVVYADAGAGAPPAILTRSFPGLTSASDGVVNVGAGGHWLLSRQRRLRLHAGIGSSQSPVAPADNVFNEVDLSTWSLGISGSLGRLQFAVGINHQSGDADDVTLRNLLSGEVVRSPIDVALTGLVYSLSYQF